jgi:hypothetical protein
VLHWVSVWRGGAEADRFVAAVRAAAARRPLRAVLVERHELEGMPAVSVVDAPAGVEPAALPRPAAHVVAAPPR